MMPPNQASHVVKCLSDWRENFRHTLTKLQSSFTFSSWELHFVYTHFCDFNGFSGKFACPPNRAHAVAVGFYNSFLWVYSELSSGGQIQSTELFSISKAKESQFCSFNLTWSLSSMRNRDVQLKDYRAIPLVFSIDEPFVINYMGSHKFPDVSCHPLGPRYNKPGLQAEKNRAHHK